MNELKFPYKIGLISTHGTGKTALAYELVGQFKKRGYKARVISEISAKVFEEGIPINENTNLSAQLLILMEQISEELRVGLKNYEILITDRSVFDNFIYLERKCGQQPYILDFILAYAKQFPYSALYKLPLVGELQADGIRAQDKFFQEDVYERLTKFLNDYKIPHKELPHPKSEFREEWIDIIINDTLKNFSKNTLFK